MSNESTSDTAAATNNEKNLRPELGALWKKEGRNQTYLTGYISNNSGERVNIVIFSSKSKKNPNQPDYRIYESLPPRPQGETQNQKPRATVKADKAEQTSSSEEDDGQLM